MCVPLLLLLPAGDLFCIYHELKAVQLRVLNRERAELIIQGWLGGNSGGNGSGSAISVRQAPTPAQVGGWWGGLGWGAWPSSPPSSLTHALSAEHAHALCCATRCPRALHTQPSSPLPPPRR